MQNKQDRQEQALERQSARDKRSLEEQLEIIKSRRGESKKETARLLSLIEERDNKPKTKKTKKGKKNRKK
tara:strand:- start:205 stop:414 length:210 start_codon:yes stop_codon:yes gene_type:complete